MKFLTGIFNTIKLAAILGSCTSYSWGLPDDIEIWFLRHPLALSKPLFLKPVMQLGKYAAACRPVGEYCFDPQIGLYDPDDLDKSIETPGLKEESASEVNKVRGFKGECDSVYKMDVFCGQSKKSKTRSTSKKAIEVWIDVSSSMRSIDPSDKSGDCFRASLVRRIQAKCSNVKIKIFDTAIRTIDAAPSACKNLGLNDQKRIQNWIRDSRAKKIFLVTDVNEITKQFMDFANNMGAGFRGLQTEDIFKAQSLPKEAEKIQKLCVSKKS